MDNQSDFEKAQSWMDIERFASSSVDEGWLWSWNFMEVIGSIDKPKWRDREDIIGDEECDYKEFNAPIGNTPTVKSMALIHLLGLVSKDDIHMLEKKRSEILVDDYEEDADVDERVRHFIDNNNGDGSGFAVVNLEAPDSAIIEDFTLWLHFARARHKVDDIKAPRANHLELLKNNKVLPYLYLMAWQKHTNAVLTQHQIAIILFPEDCYCDISIENKLRKGTIPMAEKYIQITSDGVNVNYPNIQNLGYYTGK